ncbi:DUF3662 and FHA domain-containing protein [Olsenella sp. YH-ols2223]|uniref:DUF3662 and FHA domain-containing protein n=1 Tax=Olsenella absiana TaxID=3115222 RepID=A0ABU7RAJ7_9ACTN
MNVLDIFEERIGSIFGAGGGVKSEPFSFKKLAKKAVREMEDETFVIDGIDTAPALYTVLVSTADDENMRMLYPQITEEISSLVEAQAKKRAYTFVGKPLVRFMVDPSLKQGRFAVFAENVDPRTLARLRAEESAYLNVAPTPAPTPTAQAPGAGAAPVPSPEAGPADAGLGSSSAGLEVMPDSAIDDVVDEALLRREGSDDAEEASSPATPASVELAGSTSDATVPVSTTDVHEVIAPTSLTRPATCRLIDQETGRSYPVTTQRTAIGRERVPGGIVLHDPNVSRRHAEIVYDNGEWVIHDLKSTNGTLVNDIDVEACSLRDGDVITIGLVNLTFKED